MPWNDQSGGSNRPPGGPSGGPWGDGPRSPWGQPPRQPGGGGGQAPDLEELMRRFQNRMRGGRGGGVGGADGGFKLGGPRGFMVVSGALLLLWVGMGVYTVDAGQQGVVTRFGAYDRTTGPGLQFHLPPPIESARVVDVQQQRRLEVGFSGQQDRLSESLMLTGDEAIIDIDFTVIWAVKDAEDFVFEMRDSEDAVRAVAESAMREVVGQRTLQTIITRDRAAVELATLEQMQATLDSYQSGIQIAAVQLQSATAPSVVIDAFDDVVRASQDAETAINEASKYRNEIVPQARGEAARMLQEAEAYREQVVREASGEAERFTLIYTQYRASPRVTRERLYLETMERVLGGADKIIVDQGSGVTPYLPLDQLRRSGAGQPQPTGGR